MVIIETQNRKPNNIQKTSAQSYKTQIKILLFPGLAQSDSEKPGPGATLLDWPKSRSLEVKAVLSYPLSELCSELKANPKGEPTVAQHSLWTL